MIKRFFLTLPLLLAAGPGQALEAMADREMAAVSGRDGLTVGFSSNNVTANRVSLSADDATVQSARLDLEGMRITGVGLDGASPGSNFSINSDIDVSGGATPALSVDSSWSRTRTRFDALRHSTSATSSYGALALDQSGSFSLVNTGGLFNSSGAAEARLILNNGEIYYRQRNNELIMDNLEVDVGFSNGTLGIDASDGIVLETPRLDWNLLWDIGFRPEGAPGTPFQTAGNQPMLRYGWSGGLTDARISIASGGVWQGGNPNNRTEGLNLSWRNNFAPDFKWIFGDPGANQAVVQFGSWVKLPGAAFAMKVPNLTLDTINAGQGPGPITYQGINHDVPADAGGMAVILRDVSFLAYNTDVLLKDPPNADQLFNWGLVYTLGRLDANIYLYPEARSGSEGVRIDAQVGLQDGPGGAWNENSHFMLADTDTSLAIGFVNTEFLVTIDDAYFTLVDSADAGSRGLNGIRLESTNNVQWQLEALFGGGDLTDLSNPVQLADLDLNLHAQEIDLIFSPPPVGESYIGFDWQLLLNGSYDSAGGADDPTAADSFIALSEPSRPAVQLKLGQIGGSLAARNGKIDLRSGTESADGYPRLAFEQDLQFGLTAGAEPLIINDVSLGSNRVGSIAIPGGQWRGVFALKEQLP